MIVAVPSSRRKHERKIIAQVAHCQEPPSHGWGAPGPSLGHVDGHLRAQVGAAWGATPSAGAFFEAPWVRPTIVEWARPGRGALVGVWCVGEPVCPSVRREPV
jgi:hypothetical protein